MKLKQGTKRYTIIILVVNKICITLILLNVYEVLKYLENWETITARLEFQMFHGARYVHIGQ